MYYDHSGGITGLNFIKHVPHIAKWMCSQNISHRFLSDDQESSRLEKTVYRSVYTSAPAEGLQVWWALLSKCCFPGKGECISIVQLPNVHLHKNFSCSLLKMLKLWDIMLHCVTGRWSICRLGTGLYTECKQSSSRDPFRDQGGLVSWSMDWNVVVFNNFLNCYLLLHSSPSSPEWKGVAPHHVFWVLLCMWVLTWFVSYCMLKVTFKTLHQQPRK